MSMEVGFSSIIKKKKNSEKISVLLFSLEVMSSIKTENEHKILRM